jgi:hypothetical protein
METKFESFMQEHFSSLGKERVLFFTESKFLMVTGLKISFPGPSDKMSGDVEFGSDICPMTFSSVLTRK